VHCFVAVSQLSPAQHFFGLPFFGFLQEPPAVMHFAFFFFFLASPYAPPAWS
jgi:hypothetical protein